MTRQDDFEERRMGRELMFRIIGLMMMWLITRMLTVNGEWFSSYENESPESLENWNINCLEVSEEMSEENESEPESDNLMMEFDWEGEYDFDMNELDEPMEIAINDPDHELIDEIMNLFLQNEEESTNDGISESSEFSNI